MNYTREEQEKAGQIAISDEEFSKELHALMETEIKGFDTEVFPKLIVIGRDDFNAPLHRALFVFTAFPNGKDNKATLLRNVGKKFFSELQKEKPGERVMPVAVFLVTEAWVKAIEEHEQMPKGSLADLPDKNEVVMIAGLTIDKRGNAAHTMIHRSKTGVPMLGETEYFEQTGEANNELLGSFFMGFNQGLFELLQDDNVPKSGGLHD